MKKVTFVTTNDVKFGSAKHLAEPLLAAKDHTVWHQLAAWLATQPES